MSGVPWWRWEGVMRTPFHCGPCCSLPCLPCGKEMIFCSHVLSKSQKGKPKCSQEYVSKNNNNKKVRAHFCMEVRRMCVYGRCTESHTESKESRPSTWLLAVGGLSLQALMFAIPLADLASDSRSCPSICKNSVPGGRDS